MKALIVFVKHRDHERQIPADENCELNMAFLCSAKRVQPKLLSLLRCLDGT